MQKKKLNFINLNKYLLETVHHLKNSFLKYLTVKSDLIIISVSANGIKAEAPSLVFQFASLCHAVLCPGFSLHLPGNVL